MIDLKDAATFLRLCETANLTRTATLCRVSPSTLSRTLSKLEEELGCRLCVRDKKGVSITPDGRKFERFARETIENYHTLESSLKAARRSVRGSVRIFCSVTACYLFIPRLLNELNLSAPLLEVKLETGDPAEALERLLAGRDDLVISALPGELPSQVVFEDLVTFPLILIGPRTPRFAMTGVESGDLHGIPFVMPEKGQLRFEVEKWFGTLQEQPDIYAEIAGHEAIVSLAALGFGLAVVPRLVYEISPFKNDVIILKELPWSNFRVALCALKEHAAQDRISTLLEIARAAAPSFKPDLTRRRLETLA